MGLLRWTTKPLLTWWKIIAERKTSPDLVLAWALNAKKSLHNVAGFSPFELVIGSNIKLPATLSDDLPALSVKSSSEIVLENLSTIHSAHAAAFITSENFERIRWALLHNLWISSEVKYITGDTILYKHNDSNKWWGLDMVIGQINQQVFVKHASFYVRVRVHTCRLQVVKPASQAIERNNPSIEKINKNNSTQNHNKYHYETSSDSENRSNHKPLIRCRRWRLREKPTILPITINP